MRCGDKKNIPFEVARSAALRTGISGLVIEYIVSIASGAAALPCMWRSAETERMTAVGFESTQLALVELESTPLDHSGKLSSSPGACGWPWSCPSLRLPSPIAFLHALGNEIVTQEVAPAYMKCSRGTRRGFRIRAGVSKMWTVWVAGARGGAGGVGGAGAERGAGGAEARVHFFFAVPHSFHYLTIGCVINKEIDDVCVCIFAF